MSQRHVRGVVLIVVALLCVVAAGIAVFSMGLHADATGTTGYVPTVAWILGGLGIASVVGSIISFRSPGNDRSR